jgi:thiamine-monophosphate kinase
VHFRRDLLALPDIGYRAFVAALSDLAAMGARPRAAMLSLILPQALSDAELYALIDGVAEAQRAYACPVVGGNLARGGELSITTSVIGDGAQSPLTRGGAQSGDALFVTGKLGGAALGLALLLAGKSELAPHSVSRWRRPTARVNEGEALCGVASAAIDLSDGLLQDLGHLCEASGVGCELELAKLPLADELSGAAPALGIDGSMLALSGGEDYELLFTLPKGRASNMGVQIGTMVPTAGVRLRDAAGRELDPPSQVGFDHFRKIE